MGIHIVFAIIVATAGLKWRPSFDTAAPTHETQMTIFAATIMSVKCTRMPNARMTAAYCSAREVRNTTLSRSPMRNSRPR